MFDIKPIGVEGASVFNTIFVPEAHSEGQVIDMGLSIFDVGRVPAGNSSLNDVGFCSYGFFPKDLAKMVAVENL